MKKLINILSIFILTTTSSLSVISCSKKEIPKLSLTQEKTDIVNAINLKNTNNKNLNLKIADITMVKNPIFNGKNISYNIIINQNVKNFLNNNFTYRIPEVIGNFDILNNKITNKIFKVNYLTAPLKLNTNSQGTLLGTGQNCVLYLNGDQFSDFLSSIDPIQTMKDMKINNNFVKLINDQWNSIIKIIYNNPNEYPIPDYKHGVILIIKNGKLYYTNLSKQHNNDLPLAEDGYLISSFISLDSYNNSYYIDKNILYELNNIYVSKQNNEYYGNNNWDINKINDLFKKSNFIFNHYDMNPEYLSLSTSIYNLFQNNYDTVSNLLNYYKTHSDNGIFISFDKNNNYLGYMK